MRLGFFGAARTVTGSKTLVSAAGHRLLVDCGLFQGAFETHQRNWEPLPFDPRGLDAVVFTHAHIDHSGFFPRLVREGFDGEALASAPTRALLGVLLPDAGRLQEEEARYGNAHGVSRHSPALPLFTEAEARAAVERVSAAPFGAPRELRSGLTLTLRRAGHILGAAFLELQERTGDAERTVVFSGDLGRRAVPILVDPEPLPECGLLVLESTYGDRLHDGEQPRERLAREVKEAVSRGGILLVPAFAVGRTQELLYHLHGLLEERAIPEVPVVIDSPMAASVVDLYLRFRSEHDAEMLHLEENGERPLESRFFRVTKTREESKKLNEARGPMIVISASGMANGGRVQHHLLHRLSDPSTTVLFVGYQAEGTTGRKLLEGAAEIPLLGETVGVKAAIRQITSFSAHADADELLAWVKSAPRPPRRIALNHGEPPALEALAARLRAETGAEVVIPSLGDEVTL